MALLGKNLVLQKLFNNKIINFVTNNVREKKTFVGNKLYWVDWRMKRDVKRRNCVRDFAIERLRINSMRKNTILPAEIRELADKAIQEQPRDAAWIRTTNRCVITSRPRGVVLRWRLSRIAWRHLADHNKISGALRAMW